MFINWLSALICRSSHRRCSIKKDVKNFAKFTGKHLCRGLFLVSCRTQAEEILAQVFSCEFCKISKNTFFIEPHPDDCFWICKNAGETVFILLRQRPCTHVYWQVSSACYQKRHWNEIGYSWQRANILHRRYRRDSSKTTLSY